MARDEYSEGHVTQGLWSMARKYQLMSHVTRGMRHGLKICFEVEDLWTYPEIFHIVVIIAGYSPGNVLTVFIYLIMSVGFTAGG